MWNGRFSPDLRKSVGTIKFIPLSKMTARDWEWLDYDNIRLVAQNRIARAILTGQLRGFFQVLLVQKAAKNEYLWPATPSSIQEFVDESSHDFFRNEAEVDDESDALAAVEDLRVSVGLLPISTMIEILNSLSQYVEEQDREQVIEASQNIQELPQTARELILISMMLWELELSEAEALLDEMPESDEADDVRDWLSDRFDEIAQARRTIAAGRGI